MAHFLSLQQAVLRWSLEKVEGFNDQRFEPFPDVRKGCGGR
jgi:hypothetical protein